MWFNRRRDPRVRDEIQFHRDRLVDDYMAAGMSRTDAERRAFLELGNIAQIEEHVKDVRGRWLEDLGRDTRYALRALGHSRGFTAAAVLTLALGIGANAAIFSVVEAVLLRTLPVRDPASLVIVRALTRQGTRDFFSHTDYEWLRDHASAFTGLAASAMWTLNLDVSDQKERVTGELVSGNYFSLLGVEPAAGRVIASEDEQQSRLVAVLSDGYWHRAFGGRDDVIGRELRLETIALTIVGVAPRTFHGEYVGTTPDFWLPLSVQPALSRPERSQLRTRNVSWLSVIGRLGPGTNASQAQSEMQSLLESLRADLHVDGQNDYLGSIAVEPGGGGLSNLRDAYARPLGMVMVLVAVVLLIACANVANLLLARSAARRREFAVRLAIGAGRGRLVRQLLTESFLLAAMACLIGLAIASGTVSVLLAASDVSGLDVHLNVKVLAFTMSVSCAAAILFGLAPAVQGTRVEPWPTLKEGTPRGRYGRTFNPSSLLLVAQTALSLVLLIASGLLLRTFFNLKAVSPGFDEEVLQASLDTSAVSGSGLTLGDELVGRLSVVPGVEAVSFSPFGFGQGTSRICCISLEGYRPHTNEDKTVRIQPVSPTYFRTLGIPLMAGRPFSPEDGDSAPRVAIINETMARYYFGEIDPVGKRFSWAAAAAKNIEIVGVVKDAKYDNLRQDTPRLVYLPAAQQATSPSYVQVRGRADARRPLTAIISDCGAVIRTVNRNIRVAGFETLAATVDRTLTFDLLVSGLALGFGVLATFLTSVGLYGVLAYDVARRTSELGIRMALGASRPAILQMIMKEALLLVGAGLALGLLAAVSLGHLIAKQLFGVPPHDVLSFMGAAATLAAVAVAASYVPAHRATAVQPLTALRDG